MNIVIFGDSFSSDNGVHSWVHTLANEHRIQNFSSRGASEYRIYRTVLQHLVEATQADAVVCCHTNPDRIFVPDQTPIPTRTLVDFAECDMVAADILAKKEWQSIAHTYYKYFHDDIYQQHTYDLFVEGIHRLLPNVIHISGFRSYHPLIKSIEYIFQNHQGNTNHLDLTGNQLVYQLVYQLLSELLD